MRLVQDRMRSRDIGERSKLSHSEIIYNVKRDYGITEAIQFSIIIYPVHVRSQKNTTPGCRNVAVK